MTARVSALTRVSMLLSIVTLALVATIASADEYDETISIFKNAGASSAFFSNSYGCAVFPTVGKGGLGVGAAHGKGRVYQKGKYVGDVTMNQVSIGLQAGGQAFSQIVFLEDKRAFDEFISNNFEFDATVQAVAITASATASAGSAGAAAGASGGKSDAKTVGNYHKGYRRVHRRQRRVDVPGRSRRAAFQVQGTLSEGLS
ncbi:lipid-binding SYLF domain-containing protein [Povalibacter sp.]|uniref:lipid-binding SYLF domain-containing protein n=1 Tax=Povalibacter sp. TaxID=1962978 RepID=UPI002F40C768